MEKVWLKEYPIGVPAEINPHAYSSIVEVFEDSCRRFSEKSAFSNLGCTLTYQALEAASRCFASYLQNVLVLKKGARVAIMLPNVLQYPIAMFGILRAGCVVVNVNPLYTPRELEHQLVDSGAEAIIILANFAHVLEKVLQKVPLKSVIVTELGDALSFPKSLLVNAVVRYVKRMVPPWHIPNAIRFNSVLKEGKNHGFKPAAVTGSDIAYLQYTGGTTGLSKGAALTHFNMVANMEQAGAWLKNAVELGKEIIITALPLYHIFSLTANCLVYMKIGGQNILITNPRDIPAFIKELSKISFTAITGVNTLFNALLNHPEFSKLNFRSLKLTLGGGMAVQHAVAEKWKVVTGIPLIEAYGLTEMCPAACINPLNLKDYNASVGLPLPSTIVGVFDEEGHELPIGETGELWFRGPQVMQGYWQKPEETAKTLTPDGWLKTGDIGRVDARGYVYIVDRKKDMILVSGFNVYPNEIEDVVAELPGVLESAAIGVPDEHSGEVVKLFVVKKDRRITEKEIVEHCRKNLTSYKVPRQVVFRDSLPKTNVGKILRRQLRTGIA
ncbi:MAG: AMP-binding protein [Gammaproteobacteria bacterium]|nr:AMP-binding protein [Gammaproteobacteria bacterium]